MARNKDDRDDARDTGKGQRKRRGASGLGGIRQRPDGTWEARLTLPDGRRKSIYAATQREARDKLTRATHERDRGVPIIGDERETVGAYLHGWLKRKRASLAPATHTRYGELLLHVTLAYGDMRLAALTPSHLAALYMRLQEPPPDGDGLSSSTVKRIHSCLHAALREAVRLGVVASNVTERVAAPRNNRFTVKPLSQEEARRLLDAARGQRLEALFVLALATGARLGELLALQWRAVNLDAATLDIVANLTVRPRTGAQGEHDRHDERDERWELGETKTSGSRRRVNLPPIAVDALRMHRARQLAERLEAGPLWRDRDLVFCDNLGGYLDKSGVSRYHLHPLLERAGLRRVRFHDLRHTAATLLLESGVGLKAVSGQLGHASVSTTGNVYGHITPGMRREVADMLGAILSDEDSAGNGTDGAKE